MTNKSVFQSAIRGQDGEVDAGYLGMFWAMGGTLGAIPVLLAMALLAVYVKPDTAAQIIQATGIAIGACCTGFGAAAAAVGLFRMGDKTPHPVPAPATTGGLLK